MSGIDPKAYRVTADAVVTDIDLDREEFIYHGQRLTEERAEEVAAEALRQARVKNLVPGRKSLSRDGSHSPVVQYRIPARLRDQVQQVARREGVTVSKLGRLALEEYVQRHTA